MIIAPRARPVSLQPMCTGWLPLATRPPGVIGRVHIQAGSNRRPDRRAVWHSEGVESLDRVMCNKRDEDEEGKVGAGSTLAFVWNHTHRRCVVAISTRPQCDTRGASSDLCSLTSRSKRWLCVEYVRPFPFRHDPHWSNLEEVKPDRLASAGQGNFLPLQGVAFIVAAIPLINGECHWQGESRKHRLRFASLIIEYEHSESKLSPSLSDAGPWWIANQIPLKP